MTFEKDYNKIKDFTEFLIKNGTTTLTRDEIINEAFINCITYDFENFKKELIKAIYKEKEYTSTTQGLLPPYYNKRNAVRSQKFIIGENTDNQCKKCLQLLPIAFFEINHYGRIEHSPYCKKCRNLVAYTYKETRNRQTRKYQSNPIVRKRHIEYVSAKFKEEREKKSDKYIAHLIVTSRSERDKKNGIYRIKKNDVTPTAP